MSTRDKKNVMIVALLIAVVFMSVGYAITSTQLKVEGIANIQNQPAWNVNIASIMNTNTSGVDVEGLGESVEASISGITTATFNALLKQPGDSVTYSVIVKNEGTINAQLQSITYNPTDYSEGEYIIYEIDGITAGEMLNAGESKTFTVTVRFKENEEGETKIPTNEEDLTRSLALTLNYVQA